MPNTNSPTCKYNKLISDIKFLFWMELKKIRLDFLIVFRVEVNKMINVEICL